MTEKKIADYISATNVALYREIYNRGYNDCKKEMCNSKAPLYKDIYSKGYLDCEAKITNPESTWYKNIYNAGYSDGINGKTIESSTCSYDVEMYEQVVSNTSIIISPQIEDVLKLMTATSSLAKYKLCCDMGMPPISGVVNELEDLCDKIGFDLRIPANRRNIGWFLKQVMNYMGYKGVASKTRIPKRLNSRYFCTAKIYRMDNSEDI